MLKKMRWRFIGAAMAAFAAVVVTLLCVINIWNYTSTAMQQDSTLQRLAEVDSDDVPAPAAGQITPPLDTIDRFSREVPYMIRFFSVHLSADGTMERMNQNYIASVSEEDAYGYASAALDRGNTKGYVSGYRYLIVSSDDGTVALFLNSERELQMIKNLLWITLSISIILLLVVFGLVVLFSGKAIRPYVKNMEVQKQFITNAGHELKTPLTSIITSADVLELEYENNEWVQNIQSQAGRLSKLITNLVTLSRLNEENPFPLRTEFSLSEALWEISEPFVNLARAKEKKYVQDLEDGLVFCGDRAAIQQAVSILLDNAFKYSPNNGLISFSACQDGKRIVIDVTNTLSPDNDLDTSRLFDRFYRSDQSHSRAIAGSGIGLSITKATVESHGGSVSAEKEDSTVRFRILL